MEELPSDSFEKVKARSTKNLLYFLDEVSLILDLTSCEGNLSGRAINSKFYF
jgi:hypothetical protein